MTKNPLVLNADDNVLIAAQTLAENDIGSVPVAEDGRLLGVVTDRDIVVRAIAQNRAPADTLLKEIVSVEPKYCFEDEDIDHVAQNMDDLLIRRLPVMNRGKKLIGIVSIDDLRPRQSV
jgi:CBS domain-containing protein